MKTQMVPMQITMDLLTPIIVGEYPVVFDGLLWAMFEAHLHCSERAKVALSQSLLYTDGVAHASSMAFATRAGETIIARDAPMVGRMSEDDLDADKIAPYGKKLNPYPKIQLQGGPTKNRLDLYRAMWSPQIVFYANGDVRTINKILQFYCRNIGQRAEAGYGQVCNIAVTQIEQDQSLLTPESEAARPLPVDIFRRIGGQGEQAIDLHCLTVPYWSTDGRISSVLPSRVRQVRI